VWEQRALDEIAFHFRECNLDVPGHSHASPNPSLTSPSLIPN
jgi:hypothetical protein